MLRLEDEIFKRGQKRGIEMSKGTKIKQDQSRNKEYNTLKGNALGDCSVQISYVVRIGSKLQIRTVFLIFLHYSNMPK